MQSKLTDFFAENPTVQKNSVNKKTFKYLVNSRYIVTKDDFKWEKRMSAWLRKNEL